METREPKKGQRLSLCTYRHSFPQLGPLSGGAIAGFDPAEWVNLKRWQRPLLGRHGPPCVVNIFT